MRIQKQCAERIINSYIKLNKDIIIICDKAHMNLANALKDIYGVKEKNINCLMIETKENTGEIFNECLKRNIEILVFVEPKSFSRLQIFRWLDFSYGAPKVAGLNANSYVSVLPIHSTYRVYSSDFEDDKNAKISLLSSLKDNTDYKITAPKGTELYFTSRNWIDDGNEVLTAPVEESINGIIAVDGSLFFQKINTIINFYIDHGKLKKIEGKDIQGNRLVEQYIQMTDDDFKVSGNKQLSEIGIGCNTNAIISNCFMESEMVYGTCHLCFGNNACYGRKNRSNFHGASILIKEPQFQEC